MPNQERTNVAEFIEDEIAYFLTGYVLDKQRSQPIHVEVFCEKNTLLGIVAPVCKRYNVPLTSGRGFAGPSIWRKMAGRYKASGKLDMVVLAVSDHDPEGFELVDDCIRSLRDLWGIKCHRTKHEHGHLSHRAGARGKRPQGTAPSPHQVDAPILAAKITKSRRGFAPEKGPTQRG
jgi:hypothetical protein